MRNDPSPHCRQSAPIPQYFAPFAELMAEMEREVKIQWVVGNNIFVRVINPSPVMIDRDWVQRDKGETDWILESSRILIALLTAYECDRCNRYLMFSNFLAFLFFILIVTTKKNILLFFFSLKIGQSQKKVLLSSA